MPRLRAALALTLLAVLPAGCSGVLEEQATVGGGGTADAATVERVVDGDTLVVRVDGRRERVRVIGIDTPESVRPGTPVECFAKKASARMAELVDGRAVRLVADVEPRDRYDRLLAYVERASDGLDVGEELLRGGYAQTATYPPNVARAARYRQVAAEAREAGRGLYGAC